jgi:hypothetical protein
MNPSRQSFATELTQRICAICAILALGSGLPALAAAPAKAAAGPTYQETVDYLVEKFKEAGIPGSTSVDRHGMSTTEDDQKWSITVAACESMTITATGAFHSDDPRDGEHEDFPRTWIATVPFRSIKLELSPGESKPTQPLIFSTHAVVVNQSLGITVADGFGVGRWNMASYAAEVGPWKGRWDDEVYIVAKDSAITVHSHDAFNTDPDSTGHLNPDVPLQIAVFWMPGTGATSTHVANALRHLVDICVNHPEQAPKDMF